MRLQLVAFFKEFKTKIKTFKSPKNPKDFQKQMQIQEEFHVSRVSGHPVSVLTEIIQYNCTYGDNSGHNCTYRDNSGHNCTYGDNSGHNIICPELFKKCKIRKNIFLQMPDLQ